MKNLGSWKTTFFAALAAVAICVGNLHPEYKDLCISIAGVFGAIGLALAKDSNVTGGNVSNGLKAVLICALLSFTGIQTATAQSVVDDGARFHNVWIAAPQPEGAILYTHNGVLTSDTLSTQTDSSLVTTKTNQVTKNTTSLYALNSRTESINAITASDSNGLGSNITANASIASTNGAQMTSDVCSGCSYVNKLGVDSIGGYVETYNSATEQLSSFHLPKYSFVQWNGQQTQAGIITAGQLSTTSGSDTVYLTTTGYEGGNALYSSATEYNVILSPVSSDSTVYSYKVTKAAKYFVVLVRQTNTLFHFATVANATKVDYVTVGN